MDKQEILLVKNRIAKLLGKGDGDSERNFYLLALANKQKEAANVINQIYLLLKNNQEDIKTFKELQEELSRLISSLNKYQESFSREFNVNVKNFPALLERIRISNFEDIKFPAWPEFPRVFKVSNLGDIKIPPYPEEIGIKKPSWFENFDFTRLAKQIQNAMAALTTQIKKIVYNALVKNTQPKDAIAVRLVTEDGKRFYRAGNVYVAGGGGGIVQAASRKTFNVIMAAANTEYSQVLPANTKKFLIQCRETSDIKISTSQGESGTTYLTLKGGLSYYEDFINAPAITLYFQCAELGRTVEIVAWT